MAQNFQSGARGATRPTLVDRNGRPFSMAFHEAGDMSARRERPPQFYRAALDWDQLLSTGSWRQIMSSSRFLVANVPIIRGALMEQARYSFPLQAHYMGADGEWGPIAEEFLFEWKKSNNVRGGPYDQHANSRIRMLGRKVDGDIATAIVKRDGDVFPKMQYIRAHRIGDRETGNGGVVKSGPYRGKRIRNGVIQDDYGCALAYRILGELPKDDRDLSADSVFLTFNPEVSDQGRGISELVASIGCIADIKRLREYEMRAQQVFSALNLVETNPTGTVDESSEAVTRNSSTTMPAVGVPSVVTETYGAGEIRYLKSLTGSGLAAFRGDRPSRDSQDWEDKIVTAALYGAGWDPNFALSINEPGSAWGRMVVDKVNNAIDENVRLEAKDQAREDFCALADAMNDGIIPRPKSGDAHSWDYVLERKRITMDTGNDEAAKREAYKLGQLTMRKNSASGGTWWLDDRRQRQAEVNDLCRRAMEVHTEFPEFTLQECLQLMEQRTPNANTPASGAPGAGTGEDFTGGNGENGEPKK